MSSRYATLVESTGLTRRQQGYAVEELHDVAGTKVRVGLYRDSYAFQSIYYADVWSPATLSWNRAYTAPYATYEPRMLSRHEKDEQLLLDAAEPVLEELYDYVVKLLSS